MDGDYVSKYTKDKLPKCPGKDKCPLKLEHKPNGDEAALGCCKNIHLKNLLSYLPKSKRKYEKFLIVIRNYICKYIITPTQI